MSPDLHHLSGAYAVDALDIDERSAFEHHLSLCASCQAEVSELGATAHSLGCLADSTPPASLRASVLTGIAQVRPLPPLHDEEPSVVTTLTPRAETMESGRHATVIPLFRRGSTWLVAAAAAAVLAVGGVGLTQLNNQEPTLTAVQQVQDAQDAATVTNAKGDLTATLAYSRELDQSALTVAGFPPAPDGMTYQLWYVGSDEIARSAGFLTPTDGRAEVLLEGQVSSAAAVGVTLEPAGGSQSPTSDPIVVMAVA